MWSNVTFASFLLSTRSAQTVATGRNKCVTNKNKPHRTSAGRLRKLQRNFFHDKSCTSCPKVLVSGLRKLMIKLVDQQVCTLHFNRQNKEKSKSTTKLTKMLTGFSFLWKKLYSWRYFRKGLSSSSLDPLPEAWNQVTSCGNGIRNSFLEAGIFASSAPREALVRFEFYFMLFKTSCLLFHLIREFISWGI